MNSKVNDVQPQVAVPLPDPDKAMVLVGFGKRDLVELVAMVKAGKEDEAIQASRNVPPRWRRLAICDDVDVENMKFYTEFVTKKLGFKLAGL